MNIEVQPPPQPPQAVEEEEAAVVEQLKQALHQYGREITLEMERLLKTMWYSANLLIIISIIFQCQIIITTKVTLPSKLGKCLCSNSVVSAYTAPLTMFALFVGFYPCLRNSVLPQLHNFISDHLSPLPLNRNPPSAGFVVFYMIFLVVVSVVVGVAKAFVCNGV